jgi:hypothetical protein
MKNSRRGFLASLLALLPLARSAQAGSKGTSTIRVFNAAPFPAQASVATSIVNPPPFADTATVKTVNPGAFVDFTGPAGSVTAVSVVDNNTNTWAQAAITTFPKKGQVKQFNFNMLTADNINFVLSFPSAGSAT